MKIYINHFNLEVLPELIKNLTDYRVKTEEYIQLYSNDGIYQIDQSTTIKLKPIDHDISIYQNFYKDFTIIVDPSFYIVEKVVQIPPEHVSKKIKRDVFSIHKNSNSNSKLVIETDIPINQTRNGFEFLTKKNTENAEQPVDIYFELPNGSNIEDVLVKKEIIEFLSILN
jgi:hypothetical protein